MKTWLSLGSNKCFFEMALSHKMQTHGALFSRNAYFWAQISRQGSSCHRGWYGSNVMTATHVWLHVAYLGVFSWVLRAILWGYHGGIIAFILQVRTCPQVSYTVNMSPSYNQSPGLHPPGLVCLLLTLPNETFTSPPTRRKDGHKEQMHLIPRPAFRPKDQSPSVIPAGPLVDQAPSQPSPPTMGTVRVPTSGTQNLHTSCVLFLMVMTSHEISMRTMTRKKACILHSQKYPISHFTPRDPAA